MSVSLLLAADLGAALCEPAAVLPAGGPLNKGSVSFLRKAPRQRPQLKSVWFEVKVALPRG